MKNTNEIARLLNDLVMFMRDKCGNTQTALFKVRPQWECNFLGKETEWSKENRANYELATGTIIWTAETQKQVNELIEKVLKVVAEQDELIYKLAHKK